EALVPHRGLLGAAALSGASPGLLLAQHKPKEVGMCREEVDGCCDARENRVEQVAALPPRGLADRSRSAEDLRPAILLDRPVDLILPAWEDAVDRADRNARLARDLAHASAKEAVCREHALRGIAYEPAVHRGPRLTQRVPSSALPHIDGIQVPAPESQFQNR